MALHLGFSFQFTAFVGGMYGCNLRRMVDIHVGL